MPVVAHPDSPKPELAWRDWSAPVAGLEWLNLDSEWRDESYARAGAGRGRLPGATGPGAGVAPRASDVSAVALGRRRRAAHDGWRWPGTTRTAAWAAGGGDRGDPRARAYGAVDLRGELRDVRRAGPARWTADRRRGGDARRLLDATRRGQRLHRHRRASRRRRWSTFGRRSVPRRLGWGTRCVRRRGRADLSIDAACRARVRCCCATASRWPSPRRGVAVRSVPGQAPTGSKSGSSLAAVPWIVDQSDLL